MTPSLKPTLSIIVKWMRASSGLVYCFYFSEIGTEAKRTHSASPIYPAALAPKPKPRGCQFTSPCATEPASLARQTLGSVFALFLPGRTCPSLRRILSVGMEAGLLKFFCLSPFNAQAGCEFSRGRTVPGLACVKMCSAALMYKALWEE